MIERIGSLFYKESIAASKQSPGDLTWLVVKSIMKGLKIREVRTQVHPVETRMPFHFGIAEMRRMPHLFLQVTLERNGKQATGMAADHLLPKWFTKNPKTSYENDIQELQEVVATACQIAENAATESTPFQLWWEIYHEQHRRAEAKGWAPLLASFGASLIERALIDAFGRMEQKSFSSLLRENGLGIDLGQIHPELTQRQPVEFLPAAPLTRVSVRHTVGLGDPLTDDDLQNGDWPVDGLPVSLEACIRHYGLSHFKLKIGADTGKNMARLTAIAALLKRTMSGDYLCTLDGNESYRSIADFRQFWDQLLQTPELQGLFGHLLFVEQPLHRDVALEEGIREAFRDCARVPRLIIDESDATLTSLPRALQSGYEGTSHKNCKGVFKSVANLALLKHRAGPGKPFLFSGEDLTNIGPIALLQDLCVAQNLGIDNLERNGHHYFRGLAHCPSSLWKPLLKAHPDLYHELPDECPAVQIEKGFLTSASVHGPGLGQAFPIDLKSLASLPAWQAGESTG